MRFLLTSESHLTLNIRRRKGWSARCGDDRRQGVEVSMKRGVLEDGKRGEEGINLLRKLRRKM